MQTQIKAKYNLSIKGKGGQVMVFAHGYGCDQNMWRFVAPAFEEDYKVVLFDLIGSGKSAVEAYDYEKYNSLQGYANDILEICEVLNFENVIFVGHSVSAMIGLLASVKKPSLFSHLIMVGPSPCYINDTNYYGGFSRQDIEELLVAVDSNYLGWSSAITPVIMGNPDRPELAEELENSFCRTNPEIAKHFAKVTFLSDNRQDLPNVKVKTLVIQCTSDVIAPVEVGKYVQEHMEDSQFALLEATGHCPHLSAPQETIAAIKAFLQH